ncbi:hypothetical protein Ais01nite_65130 [Asanoa ishikariensis]|uniref:Leucine rich repeat variant n=1 Tax=Asanoa ishikariensis TaxID=137265 RepID=A0A1H3NP17_9ACTN|nr:hypothetical protein [Asanoa ishikariensis]GIF68478.1 hypothetical protein Ais01nite_65130 [Asanoa ishikariensis]SDY90564.1 hypothetical protein SAMN05421684_2211 [Asanoa ishikariensis]
MPAAESSVGSEPVIDATEEDALLVDKTQRPGNHETTRARVRGLSRNPALPDTLVPRILEHPAADLVDVIHRREWSDELFDAVAAHSDVRVREMLAQAGGVSVEQRTRMVDDASFGVAMALLEGPFTTRPQPLPVWAYRKLAERPDVKRMLRLLHPNELSRAAVAALADVEDEEIASWARLTSGGQPEPMTVERLRTIAAGDSVWEKANIALEPALPEDVVASLSAHPEPRVRTYVSMRPELTEQQRTAIGSEVSENDRLPRLAWVLEAEGEQLQACVSSAHPGLRRSAACNKRLSAEQIATLAADDDFPVRLLLCENQDAVSTDLVVRTYLEARVITRGQLLSHAAIVGADLTRYADSPHWGARALVVLDRRAPAELIERLSRDEHPGVRNWVAGDKRLSQDRLLELFEAPETTEAAAANPNLPVELMAAILEAPIDADGPPEDKVLVLGHTMPTHEPIPEL